MAAGGLQMLATSNVCGVDAAVRHLLWCGVTCHPADAGDEQCVRCGCSSASSTVVLGAADVDGRCAPPPGVASRDNNNHQRQGTVVARVQSHISLSLSLRLFIVPITLYMTL